MSLILLKKTDKKKGIIVFTHKELDFFKGNYNLNFFPIKISKILTFFFKPIFKLYCSYIISKIKKDYIIGIHYGWYFKNIQVPEWVDFIMALDQTFKTTNSKIIIPFASTNFLPSHFIKKREITSFDIIMVSRDVNFKGVMKFLKVIKMYFNKYGNCKVLIICPEATNQYGKKKSFNLIQKIYSEFSDNERSHIFYIRLSAATGYLGTNREFVSMMMRKSHTLCLFSELEGVAKVINEGQLSGCNIVSYNKLEGGGRKFIDRNYDFSYSSLTSCCNSLFKSLKKKNRNFSERKKIYKKLSQEYNYQKFIINLGKYFDVPTINSKRWFKGDLSRFLPSHQWSRKHTPWISVKNAMKYSTDINNFSKLKNFYKCLDF